MLDWLLYICNNKSTRNISLRLPVAITISAWAVILDEVANTVDYYTHIEWINDALFYVSFKKIEIGLHKKLLATVNV